MQKRVQVITTMQAVFTLTSVMIGVGVLPLPRFAISSADTGAPLLTIVSIGLVFIGLSILAVLGNRFPGKSIIEYSETILGRGVAFLPGVLLAFFFAALSALISREFGEVIISAVLRQTPLEVTVLVMLFLSALSSRKNLINFVYIHTFYVPFILFPALIIAVLSLQNAEVLNLLPLTGNERQNLPIALLTISALFQGAFVLTLIIPSMKRPETAMKAVMGSIVIGGGLYLIIVLATLAVFGPGESSVMLWPTLELARMTTLPGGTLERFDAIFLIVWLISVFTTLYASYYLTIILLKKLVRFNDHRFLSTILFPVVFLMAMLPQNTFQLYEIIGWVGRWGLILTIAYPALLWIIAMIRRKRGFGT